MPRAPSLPLLLAACCVAPAAALAAQAEGYLDGASTTVVGGWARDPDNTAPIPVHIYIDGEMAHAVLADALRSDLPYADQDHGFTWTPPFLGPGEHEVAVYAIGVDASGAPDGVNPPLTHSPRTVTGSCTGATAPAAAWCAGVPAYYRDRADDTAYLFNDQLRVGVNGSYGGAIFELYGADHSFNLLAEHGGGAMQLSVWGYEPVGADAWFASGDGVCDPTPYASEAACLAAGYGACRIWCCSEGAHVADCGAVDSCVDWGAGAPFNPIQAQARDCGWDSASNDVDSLTSSASVVTTSKRAPYHFTKSSSMAGMVFAQTTTLHDACVEVDYRVTYSGPYTLNLHAQEIPALFPAAGINHDYWYYTGASPYTDAGGAVTHVSGDTDGLMLAVEGRDPYVHSGFDGTLTEHWVSVCDASGAHCLTIAFFSEPYKEITLAGTGAAWGGYGYLTPMGGFNIAPGLDLQATAFVFPGRYDATIAGQSVRRWIYDLAATELPPEDDPEDTGGSTPDDTQAGGPDDTQADTPDDTEVETPDDTEVDNPGDTQADDPSHPPGARREYSPLGCGCQPGGGAAPWLALGLLGLSRRRGRLGALTARSRPPPRQPAPPRASAPGWRLRAPCSGRAPPAPAPRGPRSDRSRGSRRSRP